MNHSLRMPPRGLPCTSRQAARFNTREDLLHRQSLACVDQFIREPNARETVKEIKYGRPSQIPKIPHSAPHFRYVQPFWALSYELSRAVVCKAGAQPCQTSAYKSTNPTFSYRRKVILSLPSLKCAQLTNGLYDDNVVAVATCRHNLAAYLANELCPVADCGCCVSYSHPSTKSTS